MLLLEHIKFSRRTKNGIKTHINFPGEAKSNRTHPNFQESFLKITQEHKRFSRRKKYHKNRSKFPGEFYRNFVRTHTIFQEEEISLEQIKISRRSCPKFR